LVGCLCVCFCLFGLWCIGQPKPPG
jgi:hypothetical protein